MTSPVPQRAGPVLGHTRRQWSRLQIYIIPCLTLSLTSPRPTNSWEPGYRRWYQAHYWGPAILFAPGRTPACRQNAPPPDLNQPHAFNHPDVPPTTGGPATIVHCPDLPSTILLSRPLKGPWPLIIELVPEMVDRPTNSFLALSSPPDPWVGVSAMTIPD